MPKDDVNFKGILGFLGLLVLTLAAVCFSAAVLLRGLEKRARQADRQIPFSIASDRPYFPAPREQPDPLADLEAWRAQEENELTHYGWVDKNAGIVRIPIDRAMELLTERTEAQP